MGYNQAKKKLKKLLLIALLVMAGNVIVGNTTSQHKCQSNTLEIKTTGEVDYWFEDELDSEDNVIGRALVVKNNTNKDVICTIVISENGKRDTITKYVPAKEQVRAYYGNKTLQVIGKPTFEDAPINL